MTRRDCNIVWNSYVISYFIIRWNNCVVCFLSDASYHKALEYSHKPMQGVEHLAYKSYLGTSPLGNGGTVLKFSVYGEFATLTRWLENICSWDCSPGHFCFSFFSNFFCIAILGTYLIENVHLSEALTHTPHVLVSKYCLSDDFFIFTIPIAAIRTVWRILFSSSLYNLVHYEHKCHWTYKILTLVSFIITYNFELPDEQIK